MTFDKTLISYYTMVRNDFVRIIRIWSQTLLPPVVTTSLYFIVFGTFIVPVLFGNIIGGTALFGLISYGQVMHEIKG